MTCVGVDVANCPLPAANSCSAPLEPPAYSTLTCRPSSAKYPSACGTSQSGASPRSGATLYIKSDTGRSLASWASAGDIPVANSAPNNKNASHRLGEIIVNLQYGTTCGTLDAISRERP